ncbi:hypothetical protein D9619_000071 [Psilocybe cf. subviscida]|uniref:Uncharacterized protein n=1 Tax=Psilocybe cf. subviscida TaxID=2480587 RepID=A0A8H5BEF2_9AGAR|nr:hypothetical protein D9619_000071 [Psilocybe cf. subviscida]
MVFATLQKLLCCCRHEPEPPNDGQEEFDETSHLIRHTIEPPVIRVDDEYERQRQHRERLANIVRNTSGRMVNLGARLPFNLHNQVLPASGSRSYSHSHSATRSVSPSHDHDDAVDQPYHPSQTYYDVYTNEESAANRPRHLNPYQSDQRSRSSSPNVDAAADAGKGPKIQVMATRLLGVRLVPHEEARARGRAAERSPQPTALPLPSATHVGGADVSGDGRIGGIGEEEGEATPRPESRKFDFKIPDVGPLTVDWD